ncbi:MAG: protease modulator HflC [Candidatus Omnitrophica bacterium]|nr:protease modulator HflC [Candidatus Omnitrophota bacterium]
MSIRAILPSILAVIGVILFVGNPFYIVDETQQVVVTELGKPVGEPITQAGLYVKIPFLQAVNRFDKRILEWDGDPNKVPTRDKKYIWIDTTGRWQINDPLKFLEAVHGDERIAQSRLDDIVDSATRDAVTSNLLIELVRNTQREFEPSEEDIQVDPEVLGDRIQSGRDEITRGILEQARPEVVELGIDLLDVRITRINYTDEVLRNVYERMISERKRVAELYRSEGQGKRAGIEGEKLKELERIRSEAYRAAQEVRGKADAEATRIYADAFSRDPEFYSFLKTLESYKGTLGDQTSLVLTTDSEYLKFLKGVGTTPE